MRLVLYSTISLLWLMTDGLSHKTFPSPFRADVLATNASFARDVSDDCLVPCGYDSQLCCAFDQVCYTDSNDEAQCSSTAVTTVTSTAISTSLCIITSISVATTNTISVSRLSTIVETSTATVTHSLSLRTKTLVQTSLATVVQTSVVSSLAIATATGGDNSTAGDGQVLTARHKLSKDDKIGVSIGVLISVVFLVAGLFLFNKYWKKREKRLSQATADGAADNGIQDTARFASQESRQTIDVAVGTDALNQRQNSIRRWGPNPYAELGHRRAPDMSGTHAAHAPPHDPSANDQYGIIPPRGQGAPRREAAGSPLGRQDAPRRDAPGSPLGRRDVPRREAAGSPPAAASSWAEDLPPNRQYPYVPPIPGEPRSYESR